MRGVVLTLGLLLLAGSAWAANPIESRLLTRSQLDAEMTTNRRLAAYVTRNGYPDVAEWRFLADQGPWDDHEVTLYYLDLRKEISFANAWMLGSPSVPVERYERELTDADVAALQPLVMRDAPLLEGRGDAVARAEAAAARAEAAVQRIEVAADATERAAARAEAVVAKMESMDSARRR
jgi:hypothetical protein